MVRGCERDQGEALRRIRAWLAGNDGWLLVVEDAAAGGAALHDCIPMGAPTGRVLVTSQARLERGITHRVELGCLSAEDCREVWYRMALFDAPVGGVGLFSAVMS